MIYCSITKLLPFAICLSFPAAIRPWPAADPFNVFRMVLNRKNNNRLGFLCKEQLGGTPLAIEENMFFTGGRGESTLGHHVGRHNNGLLQGAGEREGLQYYRY